MSDPGTYHVLVDSDGWEGRRDELAEAVAAWIGLPTARVRATLAVRGQPVSVFETEDDAHRLVAELSRLGVRSKVRRASRKSLLQLTRRQTPETARPPIDEHTVQPGWSHAFSPPAGREVADPTGTVVGLPGAERPDELQRTLIASPSDDVRVPGRPDADPAMPESSPSLRRTPTGSHRAQGLEPDAVADPSGVARPVRAGRSKPAEGPEARPAESAVDGRGAAASDAPSGGGWSDILGAALEERLIDRGVEPPVSEAVEAPRSAATEDTPAVDAASAATLHPGHPPAEHRPSRDTASVPAPRHTHMHGKGAPAPAAPLPESLRDAETSAPEPMPADDPPLERPPEFQRVRRDHAADDLPAAPLNLPSLPDERRALLWGILAPGGGQAYLGDLSSAVTHALGSFLIVPWIRGAQDAAARVRRISAGRTLPVRKPRTATTAAFVASYWAIIGLLVLGWVAFRDSFDTPTLPPVDEAAIEAQARAEVERQQAEEAARIAAEEAAAREAAAQHEIEQHARMVELLRDARAACEQERYQACRELAQMALSIDGTNREGHWLRARALNEGRALPEGTEPATDPGPTPETPPP